MKVNITLNLAKFIITRLKEELCTFRDYSANNFLGGYKISKKVWRLGKKGKEWVDDKAEIFTLSF